MKRTILLTLLCLAIALLLPLAVRFSLKRTETAPSPAPTHAPTASVTDLPQQELQTLSPAPASAPAIADALRADAELTLRVRICGETRELTLEEYLPGVLAGEMPAAFPEEALRAQAVAARTFALYRLAHPSAAHPDCALCDSAQCCQVWRSEAELKKLWGQSFDTYAEKLRKCVADTDGLYLSYRDEPIFACFHASSDGATENGGDVWGTDLPYLVSVSTPESADAVPNFVTTVELAPEELRDTIRERYPKADFSGLPETWIGELLPDGAGRVSTVRIGGVAVPGTELRSLFSLRSTDLTLVWTGHSFLFTVTGNGHGAGMSQYGAAALAAQGESFLSILAHYYPETELATRKKD